MSSRLKNSKRIFTTEPDLSSVNADIQTLKNATYKITYYEIVSGTSGSLTIPTGATINADEFGASGNSILSKIDGSNKPTYQSPQDSSGTIVTANLNVSTGAWIASGIYTDSQVALIYSIKIKAIDYPNLNYNRIIETANIDIDYYQTVQLTGSSYTQRLKLNFGSLFNLSDNTGNNSTDVGMIKADATHNGYLSSIDWSTFNNKANTDFSNVSNVAILPNGVSATTQSANDDSTKVATTAYVDTGLATKITSAGYTGQTSITTLGSIGTGTWQGTSISTTYTDAKIKGAIAATSGLIPFGTGVADTVTTSTQLKFNGTSLLVSSPSDGNTIFQFLANNNGRGVFNTDTPVTAFRIASQNALKLQLGVDANFYISLNSSGNTYFGGTTSATETIQTNGNIYCDTAGKGIVIKSGSNARIGTATLSGGTVTVSNTSVTANSRIFLTAQGITNAGHLGYSISAGTSFTISSSSPSDARTISWMIVESA